MYIYIIYIHIYIPQVPARGGAEVALKIYKTFLIYRTCMRHAPAKPMRAYTLRNWCLVSHVTFQAPRHTSHLTVLTLHTTHFTLHSSHCTLRSQHFTSHGTLRTPDFTLHSPHFTLPTSHFLKEFLKGKLLAPKLRKSADKSLSQPGCSHPNTIYNLQLQKTIVLRMQPRRQATLTQPLPCVSQHDVANLHASTHITTPDDNSHAAIPMRSATGDSKTPYNYAHTSTPKAASSHRYTAAKKTTNRPQPHLSHTRGTFHRRLQPLYTEKHTVSCSGFLPKT